MARPPEPAKKKPYSTPQLTVYGTLRALTQNHTTRGNRDSNSQHIRFTTI